MFPNENSYPFLAELHIVTQADDGRSAAYSYVRTYSIVQLVTINMHSCLRNAIPAYSLVS
jgi:hypothetical protein